MTRHLHAHVFRSGSCTNAGATSRRVCLGAGPLGDSSGRSRGKVGSFAHLANPCVGRFWGSRVSSAQDGGPEPLMSQVKASRLT